MQSLLTSRSELAQPDADMAAVAVIFRAGENSTEVLVIQRAVHERDPWSGHLAFPGGRRDPNDEGPLHTALRETQEELGLDLQAHGRVLGALDHVATAGRGVPQLVIAPFAFAVDKLPELRLDMREVARVFWVPIGPLLSGARNTNISVTHGNRRYRMPGYDVEGQVLWGLSYQMLKSFFQLLG